MAMAVAISPGVLILLLYLQNTIAQQGLNNVGYNNSPGFPQQNFQKSSCGLNQIAQNGLNFNSPQQENTQQANYQQQSDVQQVCVQQARNQPFLNSQPGNLQQPINAISNSQLLKQPNHDLAANVLSTLYNIKQSAQNQRGTRNIIQGNPSQPMNYEQMPPSQNQPNPINTGPLLKKPQNNQFSFSNSYSEYPQFQPGFNYQFVPIDNHPVQPNQQMVALPIHKVSTKDQHQSYSIQSQPTINSVTSQQTAVQSPIVMIPGTQTNAAQNQPIVLTFQSPQVPSVLHQPTLSTTQSQPIIYTVQTQPSTVSSQIQQYLELPSQKQGMNSPQMDKQSLISYVISSMQNPQGSNNILASVLPTMLNSKSEKSSSMKALLPLIFNILNEKKNCCGCPNCRCDNGNNNEHTRSEPIVNTGYSNQINYSEKKPAEVLPKITEYVDKNVDSNTEQGKPKTGEVNHNSTEASEEEEGNDSEEEYDDE